MKTSIDYWGWRSQASFAQIKQTLAAIFHGSNRPVTISPRGVGKLGFESSAAVTLGANEIGMVAWGGPSQRGWMFVGITGGGCLLIDDWNEAQAAARACSEYEARRVDIALDTYDPALGFASTLSAYRRGGFTLGSCRPKCDPTKPERPEDSAIIKIGSRQSGKYFRGYERGKFLLGPRVVAKYLRRSPDDWSEGDVVARHGGRPRSLSVGQMLAWWRFEVEFKAQKAKLPDDLIDRRDARFAGAYPHLGRLIPDVAPESISTRRQRHGELELDRFLKLVQRQHGRGLQQALHAFGGSKEAVFDLITPS